MNNKKQVKKIRAGAADNKQKTGEENKKTGRMSEKRTGKFEQQAGRTDRNRCPARDEGAAARTIRKEPRSFRKPVHLPRTSAQKMQATGGSVLPGGKQEGNCPLYGLPENKDVIIRGFYNKYSSSSTKLRRFYRWPDGQDYPGPPVSGLDGLAGRLPRPAGKAC